MAIPFDDSESVSWDELTRAMRRTSFPMDPVTSDSWPRQTLAAATQSSAEDIVGRLREAVQADRDEDSRWIAASLYVSYPPGANSPWVYQRGSGCWFAVNGGQRYDDGDLDTSGFRLLTASETPVRRHIHDDDGTVEGCPECFPAPPRVRATEGNH
jgi:hypothetical protein